MGRSSKLVVFLNIFIIFVIGNLISLLLKHHYRLFTKLSCFCFYFNYLNVFGLFFMWNRIFKSMCHDLIGSISKRLMEVFQLKQPLTLRRGNQNFETLVDKIL